MSAARGRGESNDPVPPSVIGLDIGGANLKAAHANGAACTQTFDLWKDPAGLSAALANLLAQLPSFDKLAVTMTGELCDCFESKRQGVDAILDAVETVAADRQCHPPLPPLRKGGEEGVLVWRTDGRLTDVASARKTPLQTAAANWLALATFAGRYASAGPGLLIDIGSTTTDVIPLLDGKPRPQGRTDPERLRCGELVYTGVLRTPLCALLGPEVAAELFATTMDAYLVLGKLPDDAGNCRTVDGRPANRDFAHARLARMLCADLETSTPAERHRLAETACQRQIHLVSQAIARVAGTLQEPPRTVILSGCGEFLARLALGQCSLPPQQVISLSEKLGPEVSQAACAYALAMIASLQTKPGSGS